MFQILSFTKENIVALRAQDKIVKDDYDKIKPLLRKKTEDHENLNLYLEIRDIKGITPKALWEDLKVDLSYLNKFDKVAIVGNDMWIRAMSKGSNPFFKGRIKHFYPDESLEAKRWVDENYS